MTILPSRAMRSAPGAIIVMGVAGGGKTTVGLLLAGRLAIPYAEADAFHPGGNITKMSQGLAAVSSTILGALKAKPVTGDCRGQQGPGNEAAAPPLAS